MARTFVVFKQITPLDKVEIVRIEHPDEFYKALDGMVDHIKSI
jgi:hypothetical protein